MKNKILKLTIAFALLVTMVVPTTALANNGANPSFSDIKGHWVEPYVEQAVEKGIISGFPDGTFRPDDIVQADQFLVMMLRAYSNGQGEFDPEWMDQLIDRQPAFFGSIHNTVGGLDFDFEPAKSGYWAQPFVDFAFEVGFWLYDFDGVFSQDQESFERQINREQASYLLGEWFTAVETGYQGLYELHVIHNSGFKDINDFTSGVLSSHRGTMLISGLMNGWNDHLYPKRYVTRAQALLMALRLRDESLRSPIELDLSDQYYIELNGNTYLFSDKFKYDMYHQMIDLAHENVKEGYVAIGDLGVAVFDSEQTYKENVFYKLMGQYDKSPSAEFSTSVATNHAKYIEMNIPKTFDFTYSNEFVNAIFELLAGDGYGNKLKQFVNDNKDLVNPILNFEMNNIQFSMYGVRDNIILQRHYE